MKLTLVNMQLLLNSVELLMEEPEWGDIELISSDVSQRSCPGLRLKQILAKRLDFHLHSFKFLHFRIPMHVAAKGLNSCDAQVLLTATSRDTG